MSKTTTTERRFTIQTDDGPKECIQKHTFTDHGFVTPVYATDDPRRTSGKSVFTPRTKKKLAALTAKLSADMGLTQIQMTPELEAALIKLRDADTERKLSKATDVLIELLRKP